MNTEEITKEINLLNFSIDKVKDHVKNINDLINTAPITPVVLVAPAAPAPELIMTTAANGLTYKQYIEAGWTDEQMITNGIATAPPPPAPTPPTAPPPTPPTAPAAAAPDTGVPAAPTTPEQLNDILVAEFQRLGDRAPIDAALKELGVTSASDVPIIKYQELINKVKSIVKVA